MHDNKWEAIHDKHPFRPHRRQLLETMNIATMELHRMELHRMELHRD